MISLPWTKVPFALFKTQTCEKHRAGKCIKGDKCKFAHSETDKREKPVLTKTQICKAWQAGACPVPVESCLYAHGRRDLHPLNPHAFTVMCAYFEKGECRRGENCHFAHHESELKASVRAEDGNGGFVFTSVQRCLDYRMRPVVFDMRVNTK